MLKQSKLLSLMLCLCVLSACGAKNNDWETTKGDQRYQAVTIADHSSAMCLSQDNLYLQKADSGEILQYGGGNLVTAPNSSFTRTDDGKLIVAEPLGSENLAVHVYDMSTNTQTDISLSVEGSGMAHLQCNQLLMFQDQIVLTWTGANSQLSSYRYGFVRIDTTTQSVSLSKSLKAVPAGFAVLDDKLYAAAGDKLYLVTEDALKQEATFPFQIQACGAGPEGSVILASELALFQWVPGTNQLTELLRWGDVLLSAAPSQIAVDSSGRVYCLADTTVFCCTAQADTSDANTLILATDTPQSVGSMVAQFNQSHTDYQIVVETYSSEDKSRLNVDLATGNTPDIFCFGTDFYGMSPFQPSVYAAKGMLLDMYSFIDNDPELTRDSFLPNVLGALESEDGAIYTMPSGFWADVIVGNSHRIDNRSSWNFQEMQEVVNELGYEGPVMGPHVTQDLLLQFVLAYNQDEFVDWASGTCRFDTEAFGELLQFVAQAPETQDSSEERNDFELIAAGEQLLMYGKLGNVKSIQKFQQNFGTTDLSFVGFPASSGIGNAISYDMSLAISAGCQATDAAWEFVREFYLDDYDAPAFPVNKAALLRKFAQEQAEDGETVLSDSTGFEVRMTAPSDEECDTVLALIESLDRVYRFDPELYQIVFEEASAFFKGEANLSDVLPKIQNRAQIYISEQSQ